MSGLGRKEGVVLFRDMYGQQVTRWQHTLALSALLLGCTYAPAVHE